MTKTTHLDPRDPGVQRIVRAAFPSYKGRQVKVTPWTGESFALQGNYWSGGSRNAYVAIDLATLQRLPLPSNDAPGFSAQAEARVDLTKLGPNAAIVEHSVFCGKDMGIEIHTSPTSMAPMLPQAVELTADERTVLDYTASLKSSYGGIKNFRFHEANRHEGITLEQWNTAKQALIDRKLLNKAGAITRDGRNAIA